MKIDPRGMGDDLFTRMQEAAQDARTAEASATFDVAILSGTEATIASGAYERELRAAEPAVRVTAKACPLFVPLAEEGWYSVTTIIDETVVRDIIPDLIAAGAEGIVEYALNKVVP